MLITPTRNQKPNHQTKHQIYALFHASFKKYPTIFSNSSLPGFSTVAIAFDHRLTLSVSHVTSGFLTTTSSFFFPYFPSQNVNNLTGGFLSGSCSDLLNLSNHSSTSTSSNFNPASLSTGSSSLVQCSVCGLTTLYTSAPASPNPTSTHARATTSTGNHRTLSSSRGSAPSVTADLSISGTASVAFHTPCRSSPTIWPTRSTRALNPSLSFAARRHSVSATSLLCA